MTNSSRIFVGVDPGKTGALACIREAHGQPIGIRIWDNEGSSFRTIKSICERFIEYCGYVDFKSRYAVIEAPTPVPKQSVVSVATFYKGIGHWEAFLADRCMFVYAVRPQDWKRYVAFDAVPGTSTTIRKTEARDIAASLYPSVDLGKKSDEGRSDALLMAHYARRNYDSLRCF